MPVPFRRTSKTRKRKRRTHQKAAQPTVVTCTNCGAPIKPHTICKTCGYYKGKEIINKEEK